MTASAAARVEDPFGHSQAMNGVWTGLAIGAAIGLGILLTGGLGAIAVGAAIATVGGAGLAGQAIGQTIEGPETGRILFGSDSVFINNRAAAMTVLAGGRCTQDSGPMRLVASGSDSVRIHDEPAGRVREKMDCSAVIRRGSPNVFIGGPSVPVLPIEPEVPTWLSTTMTAMAIGGGLIATGGIAATYGVGAAIGSFVGGTGGGLLGGAGGQWAAAKMGYGETGQAIGGVLGSLGLGALGGGGGMRAGSAVQAKYWPTPSQLARSWQGKGNYPGVDTYRDITLKPGQIIHAGDPGTSNYFTTGRAIQRAGNSQKGVFEGLQVQPHPKMGYRPAMRAYRVVEETPAAMGITKANPQFGKGGLPQIFVPDPSKLQPLGTTPLGIP